LKHKILLPTLALTLSFKCTFIDIEEIQRQYHRVKHAYEILSNKKLRARYNRNSFIADPTESITKTAFSAVGDMLSVGFSGLQFVGGEVMKAGQEAVSNASSASKEK